MQSQLNRTVSRVTERNVMVYRALPEVDFDLSDCPQMPRPNRVLLTTPDFFDVTYVINPHMTDHVGTVNPEEAGRQWQTLREAYERIGITPAVVPGRENLPDMVFCANQTLPFYNPRKDTRGVVLSRMHAPERRDEVSHFEDFFEEQGYEIVTMEADFAGSFEGMGDAIWHPGRYLLWGGYGIRTDVEAYEHISQRLDVSVLALELTDDDFYHLDTCFSALNEESVLICPEAFSANGLDMIDHFFDRIIEAPETEARLQFACNAHCPDGEHVLIHQDCRTTIDRLRDAGFTPLPLDTNEFMKAGGSVFCMKQMYWGEQ